MTVLNRTDPAADLARRRREDFDFMVTCAAKGNMAMYSLLRDKSLDEKPAPKSQGDLEYESWDNAFQLAQQNRKD